MTAEAPDTTPPAEPTASLDAEFNPVMLPREIVELPNLSPDETGYLVNGQFYAAVRFARGQGAARSSFAISVMAYARDFDGKPYLDAFGQAIEGAFTSAVDKAELVADPTLVERIRERALDGALREMLALIAENVAFEALNI